MSIALVILAAGKGSRMKSDLPKVLHRIADAPMVIHALDSASTLEPSRIVVVTGHGGERVRSVISEYDANAVCVVQEEQLGTAHAVDQARDALSDFSGPVIILYGDTPFIQPETLEKMLSSHRRGSNVVVLGFHAEVPGGYGRLITADDGTLDAIVEAKEATAEQLAVTFCNSGVVCADRQVLFDLISAVSNDNAKGEYYLTDIVKIARERGLSCSAVSCDEAETMGVNSRSDQVIAEAAYQEGRRAECLENGVTMRAPHTVFFSFDTVIGREAIIEQNIVFGPGVTVASGAKIRAFSHLEGCHVSKDCVVGPYARLRPGTELADGSKVGNFVEVKAAEVGEGAKINHLSYVGDALVGKDANIGAGTITCNYDGVFKHKTTIGERAFIGSNSSLVAPVRIGDDAMTGSGSVITKDVDDKALGIARARQETKPGLAARLMGALRAAKAKKSEGK